MKKIISITLTTLLILTTCLIGTSCSDNNGKITLMVYMVGSDLESRYHSGSDDMEEMLKSKVDVSRVNLLVFTGGSESWYNKIPKDINSTFLLTENDGKKSFKCVNKNKKINSMGKPETLSGFMNFAYKNYPAERYGLICWDHGNGPLIGFGRDKLFDNDSMDLGEMKKALNATPFKEDKKLDFVGFDACLMSSVEVAETLSPFANYMIASQETEPGGGWNYSFLEKFNSTFDTKIIADNIINSYIKSNQNQDDIASDPGLTLSCMDLSKTDNLIEKMDKLFSVMEKSLYNGEYQNRAIERASMKSFEKKSDYNRGYSLDLVDMRSFISKCSKQFPSEASELDAALNDIVILNKTCEDLKDVGGLSIYYPYDGSNNFAENGVKKYKSFNKSKKYLSYMNAFINTWSKGWLKSDNTVNEEYETFSGEEEVTDNDKITIKIPDSYKKSLSRAYLNIFQRDPYNPDKQYYIPILYEKEIKPDSNGNYSILKDEKIPTVNGRESILLRQISSEDKRCTYRSLFTAVNCENSNPKDVTLYCSVNNNQDDIKITSIEYDEDKDKNSAAGKNTLNSKRWETLIFKNCRGELKRGKNNAILPFYKWNTFTSMFTSERIDSNLSLKMVPISKLLYSKPDSFYYQIELTDSKGKTFVTELKNFKDENKAKATKKTVKTPKGKFTFELYNGRAVLLKYEGKDKELTIPEKVNDNTVSRIAYNAFESLRDNKHYIDTLKISNPDTSLSFYSSLGNIKKLILPEGVREIPSTAFGDNPELEEVVLPDSVERIGAEAFIQKYETKLKKLVIPKNVSYIGNGAFGGINNKNVVSISKDNSYYKIEKDMLLTKDGKKLLAYFPVDGENVSNKLTVLKGVEEIAPFTHIGRKKEVLNEIKFPSSLKLIGYNAFIDDKFSKLIFPDSVEEIGNHAFTMSQDYHEDIPVVEKVHIGKNLSWLGETIIGESRFLNLTVSKDNRSYDVKDNRLFNKAKDTDLSELSLSSWDNLERNRVEYERYDEVTKHLNLKHYNISDIKNTEKEYRGKPYYLELKIQNKHNTFTRDKKITIGGKTHSIYDNISKFVNNGFKIEKYSSDIPKKMWYGDIELINLTDKKGKQITVTAKNYTRKPKPVKNCGLNSIDINREGEFDFSKALTKKFIYNFNYMNFKSNSKIKDAIKAFGEPYSISIFSDDTIILKYQEKSKEYEIIGASLELDFKYDSKKKIALLQKFSLNTE